MVLSGRRAPNKQVVAAWMHLHIKKRWSVVGSAIVRDSCAFIYMVTMTYEALLDGEAEPEEKF